MISPSTPTVNGDLNDCEAALQPPYILKSQPIHIVTSSCEQACRKQIFGWLSELIDVGAVEARYTRLKRVKRTS